MRRGSRILRRRSRNRFQRVEVTPLPDDIIEAFEDSGRYNAEDIYWKAKVGQLTAGDVMTVAGLLQEYDETAMEDLGYQTTLEEDWLNWSIRYS